MLSVEKRKDNEEIVLSFDKDGAQRLIKLIESMLEKDVDTDEHLYTKEWAGGDLASKTNFQDATLANMLTLFFLSDDNTSEKTKVIYQSCNK